MNPKRLTLATLTMLALSAPASAQSVSTTLDIGALFGAIPRPFTVLVGQIDSDPMIEAVAISTTGSEGNPFGYGVGVATYTVLDFCPAATRGVRFAAPTVMGAFTSAHLAEINGIIKLQLVDTFLVPSAGFGAPTPTNGKVQLRLIDLLSPCP